MSFLGTARVSRLRLRMPVSHLHHRPALVLLTIALVSLSGCGPGEPRPACGDAPGIETVCGLRNPEDIAVAPDAAIILVSNMRIDSESPTGGYISSLTLPPRDIGPADAPVPLWPTAEGAAPSRPESGLGEAECTTAPAPGSFYPHGLAVSRRGERTLVHVVGHAGEAGGREAVEVFELSGTGRAASLTWVACIPTPGAIQANDVAVADNGLIAVSNFLPDGSLKHIVRASITGEPTGNVLTWTPVEGWREVPGTSAVMANGVAWTPDAKVLFYTETLTGLLHRVRSDTDGGAIAVELGGNPDNLTWTRDGMLLAATHTRGTSLMLCKLGRRPCRTGWEVYEINPQTMAVRRVMHGDGAELGAVATALEVDGTMYLSSVYDDRVGAVPLD